ncbi:MAG: hypothetical protein JSS36_02065 [Proteobacteria bacterium]|nr:hypothetical protein [Pseudomonadota bacterium]
MAFPYTYIKISTFWRGVLVAYTVKDGATTKGEVEQYLDRTWLGGFLRKKKYWRAKLPSGKIVVPRHWNREAAAKRL